MTSKHIDKYSVIHNNSPALQPTLQPLGQVWLNPPQPDLTVKCHKADCHHYNLGKTMKNSGVNTIEISSDPASWHAAAQALHEQVRQTKPMNSIDAGAIMDVSAFLRDFQEWCEGRPKPA